MNFSKNEGIRPPGQDEFETFDRFLALTLVLASSDSASIQSSNYVIKPRPLCHNWLWASNPRVTERFLSWSAPSISLSFTLTCRKFCTENFFWQVGTIGKSRANFFLPLIFFFPYTYASCVAITARNWFRQNSTHSKYSKCYFEMLCRTIITVMFHTNRWYNHSLPSRPLDRA
jgi:hypothetical protein